MDEARHAYRILRGGPRTIARLGEIFGFPESNDRRAGYRVVGVWWVHGRLKVEVYGERLGVLPVWLVPLGDERGLVRTPHLAVSYEDADREQTPELVRLLQYVGVRVSCTKLERLRNLVLEDAESWEAFGGQTLGREAEPIEAHDEGARGADGGEGAREDRGPDEDRRGPSDNRSRPSMSLPGPWGEFFSDTALQRNIMCSLRFSMSTFHVTHGDFECLFTTPGGRTRLMHFYRYPWSDPRPVADAVRNRVGGQQESYQRHEHLVTDIDDMAAITGSSDRLEELVERLLAKHTDEMIRINTTCLPMVTGDDVGPATRRIEARPEIPFLYADQLSHEPMAVLGDLLKSEQERLRPIDDHEGRYNLVGFPNTPATAELVTVLDEAGATFNGLYVPDLDVPSYRRVLGATVNVFFPNERQREIYRLAFEPLPLARIAPSAPYGLGATERWVAAVADALGRRPAAEAACNTARAAIAPRWKTLAAHAARQRLAFVVDRHHVARLLDPGRVYGLPLLEMIGEMGFELELMAYAPDGDVSYAEEALAGVVTGERATVSSFADPLSLDRLLRDSPARAVFSDLFFDYRLTTRGKASFGTPDFELGFAGALRSLERLVACCELPFYRRYARHLAASRAL